MTKDQWPPARRDCAHCGASYLPKAAVQRYCSTKCREAAKFQRIKADPTRLDAYLARHRERYTPRPPRVRRTCSMEDCDAKHLAGGFCRRHYYQDRRRRGVTDRKGRISTPTLIPALVKRYDEAGRFVNEPLKTRIRATIEGALLFPYCPECGAIMRVVPNDKGLDLRDCSACRVRASLNAEEVSWLIYEARSTRPQPPTES